MTGVYHVREDDPFGADEKPCSNYVDAFAEYLETMARQMRQNNSVEGVPRRLHLIARMMERKT
ncbi:hypothetical protein [Novosphingobium sp.]|uniref:hypothetical protein n=1 Tax=Novosphingobium sp. TaxID=1874826 RepID=UPI00356A9446